MYQNSNSNSNPKDKRKIFIFTLQPGFELGSPDPKPDDTTQCATVTHYLFVVLEKNIINFFCFQIEAGGDETEISDVPALAAYLQLGSMDWKYKTEPQPGKHPLTILVIDFKTPINIFEIKQIFGAGSKCLIRRAEVSKEFQIYFC